MAGGWFASHLEFYDLQNTLSTGTIVAIVVSMSIAFAVLLLVTLNVLISLFAIITVSCSIFVTVGLLVLVGWKLNVLESIAVTTAIGLAVDFSLHYGVHYRLAPDTTTNTRVQNTRHALSRMCGPTAMAALTTALAGAFMLPSRVIAYIQIGMFLVTVMAVSWLYSTFFLGSLLMVAGPEKGFGQFRYPTTFCRRKVAGGGNENHDRIYSSTHGISEHSLSGCSSSAMVGMIHSESHELEALTGKSNGIQTIYKKPATHMKFTRSKSAPICPAFDQSPSATSRITVILAEDLEELRPKM